MSNPVSRYFRPLCNPDIGFKILLASFVITGVLSFYELHRRQLVKAEPVKTEPVARTLQDQDLPQRSAGVVSSKAASNSNNVVVQIIPAGSDVSIAKNQQ